MLGGKSAYNGEIPRCVGGQVHCAQAQLETFPANRESTYFDWERSDWPLSPCHRALWFRWKLPVGEISPAILQPRRWIARHAWMQASKPRSYGVGSAF